MNSWERKYVSYLLFVLMLGTFALWGCPKKTEVTSTPEPKQEEIKTAETTTAPQQEMKTGETATPEVQPQETAPAAAAGLQPVYFDFDKSFIRSDAAETMKANAEWLKAHPQARIKIEGNCDERGTKEYNQALGQRRAASAKKFLTDLGISKNRVSLISYGKEKPVCTDSTESCWQKNRRDEFTVVTE